MSRPDACPHRLSLMAACDFTAKGLPPFPGPGFTKDPHRRAATVADPLSCGTGGPGSPRNVSTSVLARRDRQIRPQISAKTHRGASLRPTRKEATLQDLGFGIGGLSKATKVERHQFRPKCACTDSSVPGLCRPVVPIGLLCHRRASICFQGGFWQCS